MSELMSESDVIFENSYFEENSPQNFENSTFDFDPFGHFKDEWKRNC